MISLNPYNRHKTSVSSIRCSTFFKESGLDWKLAKATGSLILLKPNFLSNLKSRACMAFLFRIFLSHIRSSHEILTPLSRLAALLKTVAASGENFGSPFTTVQRDILINITNSLLINNVEKCTFFTYFYYALN